VLDLTHADGRALWAGADVEASAVGERLLRTAAGAPLGVAEGGDGGRLRLRLPSRLRRSGLT